MKFLLTGSILLAATLSFAQKEVGFSAQKFEYPTLQGNYKYLNEKDKKEPLFYTSAIGVSNGEVSIYNRIYRPLMFAANKVGGFSVSSGYTLFPAIGIVSFDQQMKPKIGVETIHLYDVWDKQQPYEYEATGSYFNKAANSKTDRRLADLKSTYPLAFTNFQFQPTKSVSRGIGYSFGAKYEVYETITGVSNFRTPEMVPVADAGVQNKYIVDLKTYPVKLIMFDKNIYSPVTDNWTVTAGENLEGKENKWSEYRNIHFITTDKSGKVLKDDTIKFAYARGVIFNQYSIDIDKPSQGKMVYIFGKPALMLGSKFLDPDKSKYQVAILNSDGSLAYKHVFNYGVGGYEFEPVFSYVKNDKVYVLAAKVAMNAPASLMLFEIDANGVKQADQDVKTVFGSTAAAIGKGSVLWQWSDYKVVNNQLILWGDQKKIIQHAAMSPQGAVPEIVNYVSFIAVQIDLAANKIIGQYAFDRTEGNLLYKSEVEEVVINGSKVSFIVAEDKRKRDVADVVRLNFYNNSQYAKSGLKYMNMSRPVMYTVNLGAKQANAYHISDPGYLSLYPRNSYLIDGNFIYFIGFKDIVEENAITYQVAKVLME